MISPLKFKVRELFRGNKNAEEWTILPESWAYTSNVSQLDEEQTIFDKNFVLFDIWDHEVGIYMVLNLVSRKLFWMKKEGDGRGLEDKIIEKVADVHDENGEPYIVETDWVMKGEIRKMKVGDNQIEMKHYMELDCNDFDEEERRPEWGLITVDSNLILKLDDQNEIASYEVANVEVKSKVVTPERLVPPQIRVQLQEFRERHGLPTE